MLIASNGIRDTDNGFELIGIDGSKVQIGAWDAMRILKYLKSREGVFMGILQRASKQIELEEKESSKRHAETIQESTPDIP